MLTEEGQRAVRDRSGPLYELIVRLLLKENPGCFGSREEVEEVLPSFLWPPSPPEKICDDFPHIPKFPSDYRVDGRHVKVLVSDPSEYFNLLCLRTSIKAALNKNWGYEGMMQLRAKLIAEGGTSAQFEQMIHEQVEHMENESLSPETDRPWWKLWGARKGREKGTGAGT
ncbi:MAG: hypothetical protein IIB53_11660 [Planctomycetes bacterium]|nr:hypothetical protein [Planctomycetota bacterium]